MYLGLQNRFVRPLAAGYAAVSTQLRWLSAQGTSETSSVEATVPVRVLLIGIRALAALEATAAELQIGIALAREAARVHVGLVRRRAE